MPSAVQECAGRNDEYILVSATLERAWRRKVQYSGWWGRPECFAPFCRAARPAPPAVRPSFSATYGSAVYAASSDRTELSNECYEWQNGTSEVVFIRYALQNNVMCMHDSNGQ